MSSSGAIVVAATFVWLGMVLAISFMEAPLKFRAPGVTVPLGLGIGRIVFRALNAAELVWAVLVIVAVAIGSWAGVTVPIAAGVACGALALQLVGVRPVLTRRSDHILAGEEAPRSRAHLAYVALEVVKVIALLWLGITVLAAG
ncbi:hypothetical protein [Gordonia sp. NPDC003422]